MRTYRGVIVSLLVTLAAACGGAASSPPARDPSARLLPIEEQTLAQALAKKRGGDPMGAWQMVDRLPVTSPARLDARFFEIEEAYADARTAQIGREIAGGVGGGPRATDEASLGADAPAPAALDAATVDRLIAEKRRTLRNRCYGERVAPASFVLVLTIAPDGSVQEVDLDDVKGDPAVAACARDHAAKWQFPKSAHGGDCTARMIFTR